MPVGAAARIPGSAPAKIFERARDAQHFTKTVRRGARGDPVMGRRSFACGELRCQVAEPASSREPPTSMPAATRIVCVPIEQNASLLSKISSDLCTAPLFLLIDIATLAYRAVPSSREARTHAGDGPCVPLDHTSVEIVLVETIGPQALSATRRAGVTVYGSARGSVADALAAFIAGDLPRLTTEGFLPSEPRRHGADAFSAVAGPR